MEIYTRAATASVNPFFGIRMEDIFLANTQKIADRKAVIREDTGECLGVVGKSFKPVMNQDVAEIMEKAFEPFSREISFVDHLSSTGNMWKRSLVLNDITFEVTPKDLGKVTVEVFNGYDGKNAYGYAISALRLVCTNGMRGYKKIFGESFTHRTDVIERIRATFPQKLECFQEQIAIWKHWNDIPMSKNEFGVFVAAQDGLGKKAKITLMDSFDSVTKHFGDSPNRYGAYNVLTYHQSHKLEARKGSHVFTGAHYHMDKALQNFYALPETPLEVTETALAIYNN